MAYSVNPHKQLKKGIPDFIHYRISISRPLRLLLIYLLFGGCWIVTSDWLVMKMAGNNPLLLQEIMSMKGILFIAISGLVMYNVDRVMSAKMEQTILKNDELVQQYNALEIASKEAIYEYDYCTGKMHVNGYLKDALGLPGNVLTDAHLLWKERVHADDYFRVKEGMKKQIANRETTWQDEYRLRDAKNRYRNILHSCYLILDKEGEPARMIAAMQDISEIRNLQKVYYEEKIKNETLLMQSIVEAQEKERNRWAEELHDNIGQLLVVTKLYVDSFKENLLSQNSLVPRVRETLMAAINEIRQLSAQLKPPAFNDETLETSVRSLTGNINRIKNIKFSIKMPGTIDSQLSDEHKLMIYRIIQEQVSNIVRYADTEHVYITITCKNDQAIIKIQDDGRGFDTSVQAVGIGLKNIKSRLRAFNGKMEIESAPGKGCTLIAAFNIK